MNIPGIKDMRTTLPAIVAGLSLFIALNHDLFPQTEAWAVWLTRITSFVTGPGSVILFGVNAASTHKVKEKAEEKAAEVKAVTEDMVDQKVQAVTGVTPPPHEPTIPEVKP